MKKCFLSLLLIFSLASCNQKYEFVEKENFIFDATSFATHLKNNNDSYLKYLDEYYEFLDEENPFIELNIKPTFINDEYKYYGDSYFKDDDYTYYSFAYLNQRIFIAPLIVEGKSTFSFYFQDSNDIIYAIYPPYMTYVHIVESNGVYAFVLEDVAYSKNYSLLSLILNTTYFPYEIYYQENQFRNNWKMYLIPKNKKFSKVCFKEFNKDQNIHYLNLDLIRLNMKEGN